MSKSNFRITILSTQDRSPFRCGVEALDRYFHKQVGQDMRRNMTACYVLEDLSTNKIVGFYTLSAADIPINEAPENLTKKLPRYPSLPAARLGRLAVDTSYHGQKLGAAMLADAVIRVSKSDIAMLAIIVDAKDEAAAAFYRYHGFTAYGSSPLTLIAPLKSLLPE